MYNIQLFNLYTHYVRGAHLNLQTYYKALTLKFKTLKYNGIMLNIRLKFQI